MKQTINVYQFRDAFKSSSDYKNRFSYDGLGVLFDYLEEYEESTGEELELDVIGICCEWEEADYQGIAESYGLDNDIDNWLEMDSEERKESVLAYLNDNTLVAGETDDGMIIYRQF